MEYKRVFNPEKGKWESIRVYTEEEVEDIVNLTLNKFCTFFSDELKAKVAKEWFEQFKKDKK
jgi:hypothetical protein